MCKIVEQKIWDEFNQLKINELKKKYNRLTRIFPRARRLGFTPRQREGFEEKSEIFIIKKIEKKNG